MVWPTTGGTPAARLRWPRIAGANSQIMCHSMFVFFRRLQADRPRSQRKGRKATGVPTKEQLLAALQMEEDDASEGDKKQGICSLKIGGAMRLDGADGSKQRVAGSEDGDKHDESGGRLVSRKATGCVTKQQLLAAAMQDDGDDAESIEGKEGMPSASAEVRSVHFAAGLFKGKFGKRLTVAAPGNLDNSGTVQPVPKRKGRKATGIPTKQQLLAALQQDSDGDDGSGTADESKRDVGGSKCKVRIMPPEDGDKCDESEGRLVPRKATGCVTKQQLLAVAMQDDNHHAESSEYNDQPPSSVERRILHFPPSIFNGMFGRRVTIAAPENADKAVTAQPVPKKRNRKATGTATKEKLVMVLQQQRSDEVSKKCVVQKFVRFASSQVAKTPSTRSSPVHADESTTPAPKRKGRKATGVPTKDQLFAALQQGESEGGEGDDEQGDVSARHRGAMRPGGADGTKRGVGSSKGKVKIAPHEDVKKADKSDESDESDGRPVTRKATGCVTKKQLMEIAMQGDGDDESSEDEDDQLAKKNATIHASSMQNTDVGNETWKRAADQQITEFASGKDTEAGLPRVRFDSKEEVTELPALLAAPRRRGRKATGAATKEQLLAVMSASGQGGGVAFADSEGDEAAEEETPGEVRRRCAGRKGTAFVPAAQSGLVSVEEGADKTATLPSGRLCCGKPAGSGI
ncbi:unnamed protein product [Prorocentrum cordatum]|uniref:Uncharacterized protein n=1 Tax=Prorocentrum cordatum TaxID=2364126 RepID=A0ABN9X978_9DINO|nr:unnamed protein product [Polarella glacialis]